MQDSACPRPLAKVVRPQLPHGPLNGHGVLTVALFTSFAAIGLEEFLRTTATQFLAQPAPAIAHWAEDSLMAVPLFAIGIAAADWIAERAQLCSAHRAAAVKRATLMTVACALVIAPAWFQVDRTDDPTTAQPVVFPQASDSGDVYWVSSTVIVVLACVTLLPVAAWAARAITRGQWPRMRRHPAAIARAVAAAALIAAVPVAAWLLHQAAGRAYASRVYYTSATAQVRPRPHQVNPATGRSAGDARSTRGSTAAGGATTGPAPYAFAYQAAHALEDGLVGQAAGLPVVFFALLCGPRALRAGPGRAQHAAKAGSGPAQQQLVHD
jgi:hypothetical protein